MLDTLLDPSKDPLFNRMSPDGLSITKVGRSGEEGEVKA